MGAVTGEWGQRAVPVAVGAKWCGSCKTAHPTTNFHVSRHQHDGLQTQCKTCQAANHKARRANNRDRFRRHGKRADVKQRFGISLEEYEQRMAVGVCEVCGNGPDALGRLSLDHNHATGEIRGVLCTNCNRSLGLVNDDPQRLRALAEYLERD